MFRRFFPAIFIFALIPSIAAAGPEDIPLTVRDGFDAYSHSRDRAIQAWVHGGPLEDGIDLRFPLKKLSEAEQVFGGYVGYEYISTHTYNVFAKTVYLTIHYKRGLVFAKFLLYCVPSGEWVVVSFNIDNDPDKILYPFIPSNGVQAVLF